MRFSEPPPYMEKGSTGPIVNQVLCFLNEWAKKQGEGDTGIVLDEEYGDCGVYWMKKYQQVRGIGTDGGCGPETRKTMLEKDGFDFVEVTKAHGMKLSCYVQLDGRRLYWLPGIQATEDRERAAWSVHKTYRGN